MNILYCGDNGIRNGLTFSILSLVKNIHESLCIWVLTADIDTPQTSYHPIDPHLIASLDTLLKENNPESFIKAVDITALFNAERPTANMSTRFTPCCMYRLYADLVPEIPDRILYLDYDVVCRRPFAGFYREDMERTELSGVLDHYGSWLFNLQGFRRSYINSGVLLLNMAYIRQTGLFARCRQRCSTRRMFMPDQTAINDLSSSVKLMPRRYNEQRRLHQDTVFQHFSTSFRVLPYPQIVSVKPWQADKMHSRLKLHEYDDILKEYLGFGL